MKAIQCVELGLPDKLLLNEISLGKPGPNEVKILVKACSLNFPDTLIIQGKYQFKPDLPFIPGSDISGLVLELGENVKHLRVGDEVFGFTMTGGFAEECIVPAKTIFPKPPGMPHSVAASFLLAYGTSYHALIDRANIKEGQTLLVLGASGGVGLAAIEIGKVKGLRVIAAASTSEKLELCKSKGADDLINYTIEDLKSRVKELTNGKGVDVVYDPVGGKYSELALRATAWKGKYLVVGFAAGDIPKIPLNLPLLKGCDIVGVFWGAFATKDPKANMTNSLELMQWYSSGKIKPHIQKEYSLVDAPKALNEMMKRKVMGKVVVTMNRNK